MTACMFVYKLHMYAYICMYIVYMDVRTNKQCPVACSFSLPCHGLPVGHGHFRLRLAVLANENYCEGFSRLGLSPG